MTSATFPPLGRLITAMVTPFNEAGGVNYQLALEIAEYLIENGTDSIVLTGTTGESPTLTHDEEFELFRFVLKGLKGRVPIIAGTGSNSTATAIASTQEAEKLGVAASLQVVPYYNKPSQEGLYQHFKAIAENTKLPILLYNIPSRTSRNMEPETVARLAEIPNIIGIKEASSLEQMEKVRKLTPKEFFIYSGDDVMTRPFMERGAHGVVSVVSHVAGSQIKSMIEALVAGDKKTAEAWDQKMSELFRVLFITTNPVPVKFAMRLLGFQVGAPRLPLVDVTPSEAAEIERVVDIFLESLT